MHAVMRLITQPELTAMLANWLLTRPATTEHAVVWETTSSVQNLSALLPTSAYMFTLLYILKYFFPINCYLEYFSLLLEYGHGPQETPGCRMSKSEKGGERKRR